MKNTRSVASVSEGSFFILTPCMLLLLWYKKGAWNNTTTWSGCCYNHINVEETSKNNNLPESSRGLASFISTSESASRLSSGFSLSSSCCMKQEHRLVIIWWIIYLLHEEPPGHISHHSGSQMGWTFCSILHLYTPWNCISCWVAFWVLCCIFQLLGVVFFVIALHDRLNLLLSLCLGLPFFFPFVAEHFKVFVVSPCGCLYATRAALLGTV